MKLRLMICAAAASTALFAGEEATSATYAVMNVTNAYTDTVIAVPWVGLDGSPITISNLVNTTTLNNNDKLYMYNDDGTWYEYTKSGGVWTGAETITPEGTHTAESQVVQRGSGLILHRASAGGTVLLCGRVDSDPIQTTIAAGGIETVDETETFVPGKTLFANPCATNVDINVTFTGATIGDAIMIPQNNGRSVIYTYTNATAQAEWGTFVEVSYQKNGRTRYKTEWQKGGEIPAGTGAWYESHGSSSHSIQW